MGRADVALAYFRRYENEVSHRIRCGIEENRKGNAHIRVVDKAGNPIEGVKIRYRLKNHAFRFGANLFMLDEFETPEKNAAYRKLFAELMNLATLPFYWKDQEPVQGQTRYAADGPKIYRRPATDLCLAYCKEKGIEPKGHCLNYDYFRPAWIANAPIEEYKKALEKRFRELAERYGQHIPSWEVTNETFNVPFAREFLDPAYSTFYRTKEFVPWSYRLAKEHFPQNHLIINDHTDFGCMRSPDSDFFGPRSPYYMQIERLLEDPAAKLDAIGFQYHCFISKADEERIAKTRYNPLHIFDVLDTYAELGIPLQITEMTVSALSGEEEDEEVQAELLRWLYSIFFSHPAMEAIIYWNLIDGYAYGTPGDMANGENRFYGGLFRFDFSEKPAAKMLRHLLKTEWHTEGETVAEQGEVQFRGFLGEYDLTVSQNGVVIHRSFTLQKGETQSHTIIL